MLTSPDPDDANVDQCKESNKLHEKDEHWFSGALPEALCDATCSPFFSKFTLIEQALRSTCGLIASYKACNFELEKYPPDLCQWHVDWWKD